MIATSPARLGIDIAPDAVRLVEIVVDGMGPLMRTATVVPLSGNELIDGRVADADALGSAVQAAVVAANAEAREATLCAFGHDTATAVVDLPTMTDEEVAEAIQYEVDKYVPFDIDKAEMEYRRLMRLAGPDEIQLALSGLTKDLFAELVAVGRAAGLTVKAVELVPEALRRAHGLIEVDPFTAAPDQATAIVEALPGRGECVVIVGGEIAFHRALEAADADDVRRALDFYAASAGQPVSSIRVAGAGAAETAAALGDGAQPWTPGPLLRSEAKVGSPTPELATAVGLAMPAPVSQVVGQPPKRRGWLSRLLGG